jgi:hypothetical protein
MLSEGTYLVIDKLGGRYDDALSLLVEAVSDKSLPADVKPIINPYHGVIIDTVEPSNTSVATADLLTWLESVCRISHTQESVADRAETTVSGHEAPLSLRLTDIASSWAEESKGDLSTICGTLSRFFAALPDLPNDAIWVTGALGQRLDVAAPSKEEIARHLTHRDERYGWTSFADVRISAKWFAGALARQRIPPPSFVLDLVPEQESPAVAADKVVEALPVSHRQEEAKDAEQGTKGWKVQAREIAQDIGLVRWNRGERNITARNICDAVATELGKNQKHHGNQGPRSAGAVRSLALKGWKFPHPNGTNGSDGSDGTDE